MIKRIIWGAVLGVAAWVVWRSRTRSSEDTPYTPPTRTPPSRDPSIYALKPSPLEQVKETVSSKVDEARVAAADLKESASETLEHVKEVVATKVDEAKVVATDLKDATQTKLHDVKDTVEDKAAHLHDKAEDKLTDAKDAVAEAKDSAAEAVAEAKDSAAEAVAEAKDSAAEVVAEAKDSAAEAVADAKDSAAGHSQIGPLNVYCVRCHEHRTLENPKIEITSNGRRAARGTCPVCHANVFTFLTQNSHTPPK